MGTPPNPIWAFPSIHQGRVYMRLLRRTSLMIVALVGLGAVSAWAQSGTASVSGRVTDPQPSAVPGALVTLSGAATAASRTTETNASGLYQFAALRPGLYDLKVELSGFRTASVVKIELRVDMNLRQGIQLAVGNIAEAITVQAESPLLN